MLQIIHEDEHLLVVAKPAGLSTQAPAIAGDTLERRVRTYLRPDDPVSAYAGTVHRLDRPVSGLVLWAKNSRAARLLAQQFERRSVRKEYWALVAGTTVPPAGIWEDWLCREDTGLGRVQRVGPGTPRAQSARTTAIAEGRLGLPTNVWWLRLLPETGRMHQLRVQTSARGYPILGDSMYGSDQPFAGEGIALHARRLTFRHPRAGQELTLEAPLPEGWPEPLRAFDSDDG